MFRDYKKAVYGLGSEFEFGVIMINTLNSSYTTQPNSSCQFLVG